MKYACIQQTKLHLDPLFIDRLITKVEVIGEAVVDKAVCLQSIANALELATASLVLTLALHLARLLVYREVFLQAAKQ